MCVAMGTMVASADLAIGFFEGQMSLSCSRQGIGRECRENAGVAQTGVNHTGVSGCQNGRKWAMMGAGASLAPKGNNPWIQF